MTDLDPRPPVLGGARRAAGYEPPDPSLWRPEIERAFRPFVVAAPVERRKWWQRGPSAAELAYRADSDVIRALVAPKSRHVVIVNWKSGAKTPTAKLLGDAIGVHRGGDVVVWDGSDSAGTLSTRSEGQQAFSVGDLATAPEKFEDRPAISAAVALQTSNSHVIGSTVERSFEELDIETVAGVLNPFYPLQIVDTGANAAHGSAWLGLNGIADAYVVPVTLTADTVNKGAELIYALTSRDQSAMRVVAIIHQVGMQVTTEQARATLTAAGADRIVVVPFDSHIQRGGVLVWSLLAEPTRHAFTRAAAQVAGALEGLPE